MHDLSETYKKANEMLDIYKVCDWLGIHVVKNKAICLSHREKTPSFTIYPKGNRFKCFGCGLSGDVITLTALSKGLTNREALQILNDTFNLGLDLKRWDKSDKSKIRQAKANRSKNQLYQEWKSLAAIRLSDYIGICNDVIYNDDIEPYFRNRADTERILAEDIQNELMEMGDSKEAYEKYGKEVIEIVENRLQRGENIERAIGCDRDSE